MRSPGSRRLCWRAAVDAVQERGRHAVIADHCDLASVARLETVYSDALVESMAVAEEEREALRSPVTRIFEAGLAVGLELGSGGATASSARSSPSRSSTRSSSSATRLELRRRPDEHVVHVEQAEQVALQQGIARPRQHRLGVAARPDLLRGVEVPPPRPARACRARARAARRRGAPVGERLVVAGGPGRAELRSRAGGRRSGRARAGS